MREREREREKGISRIKKYKVCHKMCAILKQQEVEKISQNNRTRRGNDKKYESGKNK